MRPTLHVIEKGADVALCGETRDGAEPGDSHTPWCPRCVAEFQRRHDAHPDDWGPRP